MLSVKSVLSPSAKLCSSVLFLKSKGFKSKSTPLLVASCAASIIMAVCAPALAQQPTLKAKMTHQETAQYNGSATQGTIISQQMNTSQQQVFGSADHLIKLAKQKNLASHPTWLRLHYYKPDRIPKDSRVSAKVNYRSKVSNPDFFISEQGKTNPQAELEAFIKATVTQGIDGNDSVVCRFPARTYWLQQQLGLEQVQPNCPDLEAWIKKIDPQQFSIIFAEEYPDRAVSAFGHTLLLIDSTKSLQDPTAVDKAHTLNDTVGGNPDDPFVVYGLKSAFGSYPNDITIDPYTQTLHEYLQEDNRDIWTYVLDLTEDEIQQIMRHVWETKDLELPYYFTLDNCASEILRYIDVVRPEGNLLDQFKVAVVPKDIIQLLDKEGLITQKSYIPADRTLAQAKLNNPELRDLPSTSLNHNNKFNITHLKPANNDALDAHARQRVMMGLGAQDDTKYLTLAYRGGFNSPLDRPSGYPQNFHLEAGSVDMRVYKDDEKGKGDHDRIELQQLTILRGRSFNPLNTAKKGDLLLSSWGVSIQANQVKDGSQMSKDNPNDHLDSSHLVGSLGYEKGVSVAFGNPEKDSGQLPPHLCYAFGTGTGQVGKGLSKGYRIGAGVNLGCRYQFSHNARLIGELQLPYWYHGSSNSDQLKSSYWQPILSLGAQYDLDKNQAIRLQGSYELQSDIKGQDDIQLAYIKHF